MGNAKWYMLGHYDNGVFDNVVCGVLAQLGDGLFVV